MRKDKAAQRRGNDGSETKEDGNAMQREVERGRIRSTPFLLDPVGALLFRMDKVIKQAWDLVRLVNRRAGD